jgi:hypothetical protein
MMVQRSFFPDPVQLPAGYVFFPFACSIKSPSVNNITQVIN